MVFAHRPQRRRRRRPDRLAAERLEARCLLAADMMAGIRQIDWADETVTARADGWIVTTEGGAPQVAYHVIPPVPVRQWVISVPKRLRGMLADRPPAVAVLTKIFLRPQTVVGLRIRCAGQWRNGIDLPTRLEADAGDKSYWITVAPETEINWRIRSAGGGLAMQFSGQGANLGKVEGVELVFPFAPGVTPVTAISSVWNDDGSFQLPALVSAPDFGQMLLTGKSADPDRKPIKKA